MGLVKAVNYANRNSVSAFKLDWYGSRTWRCELGEGPGLADVILLRDVRV